MKRNVTDKYEKAFIKVAECLVGDVPFDELTSVTKIDKNGVAKHVTLKGHACGIRVEVSTEEDPNKGLQIVVKHFDIKTDILISERKVWYFTFNWKALMALS